MDYNDVTKEEVINSKSTKSKIYSAYQETLKKLRQNNENSMKVRDTKAAIEKNSVINETEQALTINGIETLIRQVEMFSSALSDELQTYENVKRAVKAKQDELKEMFEIEKTAETLASLVDANATIVSRFELDKTTRLNDLQKELTLIRQKCNDEKSAHEESMKKLKEEELYNFERQKKIRLNELEDVLDEKKKEAILAIQEKHEELKARIKETEEKEARVVAAEEEINKLKKEVSEFPEKLAAAIKAEVGKEKGMLTNAFEKEKLYLESTLKTETKVAQAKIAELEKTIITQLDTILTLQERLDSSYKEIKEMAVKTVEGVGNNKMISDLMQKIGETPSKK